MKSDDKKKEVAKKMHRTHSSVEHCRHCGTKVSSSTRYESGHREYDHEKESTSNLKH